MVETEESYPLALEAIDQLPIPLQAMLIENLSSVHAAPLARFFWLVAEEYSGDVQKSARRALEKFRLAGLPLDDWRIAGPRYPRHLFAAYASKSRIQGQITLVMAWRQLNQKLDVRYFVLKFGPEGVSRYFAVNDQSVEAFQDEQKQRQQEMVPISYEEACYLLQEAFQYNLEPGRHAARPVFQYRQWLEQPCRLGEQAVGELTQRLTGNLLTPRQTANAYYLAEAHGDWGLLYDLAAARTTIRRQYRWEYQQQQIMQKLSPRTYLKTRVLAEEIRKKSAELQVQLILEEEDKLLRRVQNIRLVQEAAGWRVAQVEDVLQQPLAEHDPANPLNYEVFCALYDMQESAAVRSFLSELPEVQLFGDFPTGTHYRWNQNTDPLVEGIDFAGNIFAEFILADDEMLVIAQERATLDGVCNLVERYLSDAVVRYRQQYHLDVSLAYAVLGGEYPGFEELLAELAVEEPEEKLPFIVATYEIRELAPVLDKLHSFKGFEFNLPEGTRVFYEYEQIRPLAGGTEKGEGFVAEYRLTPAFLTVASFGKEYMDSICEELEEGMASYLQLIDMQEREEGLDLLAVVNPGAIARERYNRWKQEELRRWLTTELSPLSGLSPLQARRTIKGRRQLWALFKLMKDLQREFVRRGLNPPLDYREYIRALEMEEAEAENG